MGIHLLFQPFTTSSIYYPRERKLLMDLENFAFKKPYRI